MSMAVSLGATVHPAFGAAWGASRTAIEGRAMIFAVVVLRRPAPESRGPLGRHPEAAADTRRVPSDEAVKGKVLSTRTPEDPFLSYRVGSESHPPAQS